MFQMWKIALDICSLARCCKLCVTFLFLQMSQALHQIHQALNTSPFMNFVIKFKLRKHPARLIYHSVCVPQQNHLYNNYYYSLCALKWVFDTHAQLFSAYRGPRYVELEKCSCLSVSHGASLRRVRHQPALCVRHSSTCCPQKGCLTFP